MDDEIQLVSDGDGLAVIGETTAVESFLRSRGLWAESKAFDLGRLKDLLTFGSDVSKATSEIAANSSRWVKLTDESARLLNEHGLMESKTPGESHLMVGVPGSIKSWLQAETGSSPLLTNPAVLSGVGGLMAQVAARQAMAEITTYLARIDQKVDDVLRKQDNAVVASMVGVGVAIDRAMTIRGEAAEVDDTLWSTVDQAHITIGATQAYALSELDAIAKSLESTKVGELATNAKAAEPEVQKWLGVLARCFQWQEEVDVLELDKRMAQSPEKLEAYRRGMKRHRHKSRELISEHTEDLLARMDMAVGRANAKMVWTRTRSMAVVESGNHVAVELHHFTDALGIEADSRSWEPRQLASGANLGSQAIQKTKDGAPVVAAAAVALVSAAAAWQKFQDEGKA
jgi:hypothetical protein